jgi:hypothetical protein
LEINGTAKPSRPKYLQLMMLRQARLKFILNKSRVYAESKIAVSAIKGEHDPYDVLNPLGSA